MHFRCGHPEAQGIRVDIMSVMRGVDPFPELWARRTTVTLDDDDLDVMSLLDLVIAKKTQRDKDWTMIRRLVDGSYFANAADPTDDLLAFWFREIRSVEILVRLVREYPDHAASVLRDVVQLALAGADETALVDALYKEEQKQRSEDKIYWEPLRSELTKLRHAKP